MDFILILYGFYIDFLYDFLLFEVLRLLASTTALHALLAFFDIFENFDFFEKSDFFYILCVFGGWLRFWWLLV